jgi:hypothetical protein
MEEERTSLSKEESDRWKSLLSRQQGELQAFDVETTAIGLSAAEVAAASQDPDADQLSTQVSTLSLSASSSSNSFTSQTPL